MADRQSPPFLPLANELMLVQHVPPIELQIQTVVYHSQAEMQLEADVYRPAALPSDQQRLTVIMIHGGPVPKSSNPKDWRIFRDYAALFAGLGVVTIVFNHRLHGPAEYFTAQGDVIALLQHVRAHARDYNVDPDRLLLWAFAGGGPLLTVALDPPQPYICGIIAYYCLLDFATSAKSGGMQAASREILDRLSPAAQLRKHGCRAPILVARAGRDSAAANRSLATFLEAALARDVAIELLNHPNGEHAFDVRNNDARSHEIISRTLDFIRARAAAV
jgi:acetyl esterase/lipase